MQITLNHDEIVQAIVQYVGQQGIDLTDKCTEVNMIAGRGANGFTASVSIERNTNHGVSQTSTVNPVQSENSTAKTEESPSPLADVEDIESDTDSLFGE